MRRLIALASVLLILAAGSSADAGCRLCVESITAQSSGSGSGWGKSISLRVIARAADPASAPATASQTLAQRSIAVVPAPATQAPAAATPVAVAAAQPGGVQQEGSTGGLSAPDQQGILLGIGIVAFVAGSVLLERRRSAAHRTEGALEA